MIPVIAGPRLFIEPAPTFQTGTINVTLDKPSGTVSGDLLAAIAGIRTPATWTPHANFTERFDGSSLTVATCVAGGSEPSNYTFSASNNNPSAGTIIRIAGAAYDTIGAASSSGSSPAAPQITMSAFGLLFAVFWDSTAEGRTFTTPPGMIEVASTATSISFAIFAQWIGPGATGTRTSTVSAGSQAVGLLFGVV